MSINDVLEVMMLLSINDASNTLDPFVYEGYTC